MRYNKLKSLPSDLTQLPLLTLIEVEGNPNLRPQDYDLVLRNLAQHDTVGSRKNEEINLRILRGEAQWKNNQSHNKAHDHQS